MPITIVQQRIQTLEQRLKKPATEISNIHGWLNNRDLDSLMQANAIKNYRAAWQLFRQVHRAGVPVFHKKRAEQKYQTSCQYAQQVKIPNMLTGSVRLLDKKHLRLPKIGRLRFRGLPPKLLHKAAVIRIGTVTISMDATGRYYVSLQLASEQPFVELTSVEKSPLGIDLNTANFLTDSNGHVVANPRYYRRLRSGSQPPPPEGKLAQAQRKLSRRALRAKKEQRPLRQAANYQKQRVANQRQNFLHLVSTTLIKNHDLVVAEELRSNNTQTCSHCGFIMGTGKTEKLTLRDREWTCPQCGKHHLRDENAAQNILTKGLASI